MNIQVFRNLAPRLPAEISVLMRGATGIGKSALARQIAQDLNLPYMDIRASQQSEGDCSGYPDIEGMKEKNGRFGEKVMSFCMPSWFMRGCKEPVMLMLDELNRALPGVQQAYFQLILDREMGMNQDGESYRLHPQTRIYVGINDGSSYDVSSLDPALLRRFWTVDLEPTHEDWIFWAQKNDVDPVTIDFVRNNPNHLRVDPSKGTPGTVLPTPASWHRLDVSLRHMGMAPSNCCGSRPEGFYALCTGFVGNEAAIAFSEFVHKYENIISAKDVLDGKVSTKKAEKLGASEALAVIDRLIEHATKNKWTATDAQRACEFAKTRSDEQTLHFMNNILKCGNLPNVQAVHSIIGKDIVNLIQKARALQTGK